MKRCIDQSAGHILCLCLIDCVLSCLDDKAFILFLSHLFIYSQLLPLYCFFPFRCLLPSSHSL